MITRLLFLFFVDAIRHVLDIPRTIVGHAVGHVGAMGGAIRAIGGR